MQVQGDDYAARASLAFGDAADPTVPPGPGEDAGAGRTHGDARSRSLPGALLAVVAGQPTGTATRLTRQRSGAGPRRTLRCGWPRRPCLHSVSNSALLISNCAMSTVNKLCSQPVAHTHANTRWQTWKACWHKPSRVRISHPPPPSPTQTRRPSTGQARRSSSRAHEPSVPV